MGTKRKYGCDEGNCKEMKHEDLLDFSNIFAPEFNNSSLHDRILVFQVVEERSEDGGVTDPSLSIGEYTSGIGGYEKEPTDGINDINDDRANSEFKQAVGLTVNDNSAQAKSSNTGSPNSNQESLVFEHKNKGEKNEKEQTEEDTHMRQEVDEEQGVEDKEKGDDSKWEEEAGNVQIHLIGNNTVSEDSNSNTNLRKLFVHSCFLSVQSPYFRALFCSGMKESLSKEVIMRVTESELLPHLTLIEAMYRLDVLNDKDYNHVLKVLVLADKYDVNLVLKKCKYILMSTSLTLEKCEYILETVKDLPEFTDLLHVLEKFLVNEFTPLDKTWNMDKFIGLSEASLRLLFSSNDLAVRSENTVFVALMAWIRSNETELILSQSTLLSLVRFELLTVDFLFDVVQHSKVAKGMPDFNKFLQNGLGYHAFSRARRDQLKIKPVQRILYKDAGPTFSWIVDKDARKKLVDSTSTSSDVFWFKGYPMELELKYATDSGRYEIFLLVLNMREGSCLNISWKVKSELFEDVSDEMREMYTGENNSWGFVDLEGNIEPSELPGAVSHTTDVWVKFI